MQNPNMLDPQIPLKDVVKKNQHMYIKVDMLSFLGVRR